MTLDSYLEIFTTMYGWAFANIIGGMLTGTGIMLLPFAMMVFNTWKEAKESGNETGITGLIDVISTKLWIMLFVFSTCFATTNITSLSNVNLKYTPIATASNPTPTPGSQNGTGSTYDTAMANAFNGSMSTSGDLYYVPLWWYTVMAVSSGINNSFRAGLTNGTSDLRRVEELARTSTITDGGLKYEVSRFYSECYAPARAKFLRDGATSLTPAGRAIIQVTNKEYGPTDTDWIGSQLFRTEPGYYDTMRSMNPVSGFSIDYSRDVDYYQAGVSPAPLQNDMAPVNPEYGRPYCKDWWENSSTGLRNKMVGHTSTWQQLGNAVQTSFSGLSPDQNKDAVAKLATQRSSPQYTDPANLMGNPEYGWLINNARKLGNVLATGGMFLANLGTLLTFGPLIQALPMMQALILMTMYMFLPFITLIGGYNIKIMFMGAMAIFTVKFWAVMWTVAAWVDANLMSAMYPSSMNWSQVADLLTGSGAALENGEKRLLLNLLLIGMFLGIPVIWTAMMAWANIQMGNHIDRLGGAATKGTSDDAVRKTPVLGKK